MTFTITEQAAAFYKKELNLNKGDSLSFYVRVGGVGSGGFSAGLYKGKPDIEYTSVEKQDITFCIHQDDMWYFDGMTIDYHDDYNEVTFENSRIGSVINPQ
ncbi:hypothetical protein HXA34_11170 [Salipaludibacillus agaradhaerens]|uniref:Core domain-containing protein n=1 Tax=Salipaludibacillus agaradhaerens TaxID=76935 RepID=A0A9Q4B0S3_SALAG|nr:iron-sulfur cluster biosynthesis family protein [Salipaludibacillus agaradhaerens]MCR6110921.1 hypothetical protein [Bacillus sp. A301a_S52]UJW57955.1 hypothetical protein HXZ66_11310 [Bacillus sp. A116_S68]MCR6096247.1 hypothetical protein [Salipaludibacillus agaradhaerens]MCR6106849.1 hypothetical protein [Salipaludibacillus agaradhaerens]MCR6114194.1 hypothetical protein [Salipaludibacillus agaradhaerens]